MTHDPNHRIDTHEAVCAERYKVIIEKLNGIESRFEKFNERIVSLEHKAQQGLGAWKLIGIIGGVTATVLAIMQVFGLS